MQKFEDKQEVAEWLETLNYEQFWQETDPNGLNAIERSNCDISIARGVDKDMILRCIKAKKRLEIVHEQDLKVRITKPKTTLH